MLLSHLRERLLEGAPTFPEHHRRASVAIVLRTTGREAEELLLMQRAEREGDRWSGQVSFPGGHVDAGDPSALAAAVRETREEIGVDLEASAEWIGCLPPRQALAAGAPLDLTIAPFVFSCPLARPAPELRLGPEAQRAFWLPLRPALAGELDAAFLYRSGDRSRELPCFDFEGQRIWGMTHRMIRELFELANA